MAKSNKIKEKDSSAQQGNGSQKSHLVSYFMVFVFGFLAGIAFTVYKGDAPTPAVPSDPGEQAQAHDEEAHQAIINLEAEVTANPENFQSWIRLGHLYYDSDQPQKAIGAYTKSLEFHSGDANLLTDLGVMYRRTEQPQKALESFDQAIKKDPVHLPARFNKGIVLMYDMGDTNEAIAIWEEILTINPQAKTANGKLISVFIEEMKADQVKNK